MFTKTSKQVLAPLAESVSALIVIISDSELNGTPIPDLSLLSKALEAQLSNLLGVAAKIVQQSTADDQLKADMPAACEEVSNTSKILVSSVQELVQNAVSNSGRKNLLEAVRGILSGTTHILQVVDDAQVRKILTASAVFRMNLLDLTNYSTATQGEQLAQPVAKAYIQCVTQASQKVVALAQLSTQRVGEILSDLLQQELQDANKVLTKESPLVVSACKLILTHPGVEDVLLVMNGVCERLRLASLRIDEIVQWKGDDANGTILSERLAAIGGSNVSDHRKKLSARLLAESFFVTYGKNPTDTQEMCREYIGACVGNIEEIQESLQDVSVTNNSEFSQSVVKEMQSNTTRLELLTMDAPSISNGTLARKSAVDTEIRDLTLAIDQGFTTLEAGVSRGLVGDLITTIGTLSDSTRVGSLVSTMLSSALSQDAFTAAISTNQFICENQKLGKLVHHSLAIKGILNPQLCQQVAMQYSRVEGLGPAVSLAAGLISSNPADSHFQEHFKTVMASYIEATRDLQTSLVTQEGVFSADDLIFGSKYAFDQQVISLRKEIESGDDSSRMTQRLAAMQVAAAQLITIAEKEREYSEDVGYQSELTMKLNVINAVLPGMAHNAQALILQNGEEKGSRIQEFNLMIENITEQLSGLGATVQAHKGGNVELLTFPAVVHVSETHVVAGEDHFETVDLFVPLAKDSVQLMDASSIPVAAKLPRRQSRASYVSHASNIEDEALRMLANMVSETVLVDEVAPQMLTEEEAFLDPIKAAGQELKVEASIWATESNPIIEAVDCMSQRMLDLSRYHQMLTHSAHDTGSKRLFIQAAQAIMTDANTLLKVTQNLADACTDRRLRTQLKNTLTHITTLAQQLKIVAAVKASSPSDADKDVQLISCAQNLMKSVKRGLRECVSCSLRVKKSAEGTVNDSIITFRRVIYNTK
ncbi:hypothetical protein BASA50_002594 [Batrachochytrium salamandrivorans]|uniref:Vinculin-binding site-containing domain-containing protein n=1 Tax=Batrachochytrium salamandrivorans TaxID=1357716 RepID=A0ABQ8FKS8_9FUNG|nr:hypothetical protein BASA60_009259 [Batrachochytrium salamandrivorans]KAH6574792.1 hypothetical protein BASA62_002279 [Batrachochytrium salamandrivorans]KAH6600006.1 hypothetical protein BASA50_002594 [Batrachochytrium salamandrivorans]